MSNYQYRAIDLDRLNQRFAVGQKVTSSELGKIIQACNCLSAMRWSASCYLGAGFSLSSAYLYWFVPTAGSGRQLWQVYFAANTASTMPASVYLYTMARGTTIGYTTSTVSTWSIPSVSGYTNTKIFAPVYGSSNSAITYRTPSSYGCGTMRLGAITGTAPMTFGVVPYGPAYTYNEGLARYCASDGTPGVSYYTNGNLNTQLSAGILRVCDEMLDTAETMPVPICMVPFWESGVTAPGSASNALGIPGALSANLQRWVPLVNLRRKRALWVAVYGSQTTLTNARLSWEINDADGSISNLTTSEYTVYSSGRYALVAVPINEDWLRTNQAVAGLPLHFVRLSCSYVAGISAWIGDMP